MVYTEPHGPYSTNRYACRFLSKAQSPRSSSTLRKESVPPRITRSMAIRSSHQVSEEGMMAIDMIDLSTAVSSERSSIRLPSYTSEPAYRGSANARGQAPARDIVDGAPDLVRRGGHCCPSCPVRRPLKANLCRVSGH
ncbi:hypothetical protein J6590_055353 [Homalodisca vitripennis]|nr:hypothetical protein J6590_055353 [Homalodisca vitripennis]